MKNEIKHLILPEIGCLIVKANRRRGYAKEAARASGMTLRNVFTAAEGEKTLVYVIRREQWRKRSGKSKNRKGKRIKKWAPSYGMVPTIQRGSSDLAGK